MGRPAGAKNKPGGQKPGRRGGSTHLPHPTDEQVREMKEEILRLIGLGEAVTLSEAAQKLGINPTRPHSWAQGDPEFKKLYLQAREVVADEIEKWLIESNNVIAKIFLLKGYRPEFKDNYRTAEIRDERVLEYLRELRELARTPQVTVTEEIKQLPEAKQEENPFASVIERIKSNERATFEVGA